jgi:hypothetical protein
VIPAGDSGVERLSAWSHERQGLGHAFRDPLTALRDVVGVYSAHPAGPLTLAARCSQLDAESFHALEVRREAVRIIGMRSSAFLVPLDLADDIIAATRRDSEWQPAVLRSRGLDADTYAALQPLVLEAASEPLTPTQLRRALGVGADDDRAYFTMRLMAREGSILRVGTGRVRSDDLRWVSTEAWLGRSLGDGDPGAALGRLAAAYLHGYGPARMSDFAWWAGVTRRRASAAIESVDTVPVGGDLLLPRDVEPLWQKGVPLDPESIDVLPKWDAYSMGYAPDGRRRFVADAHLPLAYSTAGTKIGATAGDGLPLILRGGRAVATWSHRLSGKTMSVTVSPFDMSAREGEELLAKTASEFERIGQLFEARVETSLAAR